jgi:hypothetical protein
VVVIGVFVGLYLAKRRADARIQSALDRSNNEGDSTKGVE